jgi:hypothetical protein
MLTVLRNNPREERRLVVVTSSGGDLKEMVLQVVFLLVSKCKLKRMKEGINHNFFPQFCSYEYFVMRNNLVDIVSVILNNKISQ